MKRCEFCGCGMVELFTSTPRNGCNTIDCPGNPETKAGEDPRLLKAIHDAVVAEACRWRGIPKPTSCGEFVRIDDIWRYARVALAEVRRFESDADNRPPGWAVAPQRFRHKVTGAVARLLMASDRCIKLIDDSPSVFTYATRADLLKDWDRIDDAGKAKGV